MKKTKSLDNSVLSVYLSAQLNHFFPDPSPVEAQELKLWIDAAEDRIFRCFEGIEKKYFNDQGQVFFHHLQTDQYCMYLYMLANYIHTEGGEASLCTKLYALNKALHHVDIYFTSQLPEVFLLVHPLGTIIGRGKFSGRFVAYQGCTVGCLNEGIFPEFRGDCILYANASVLGQCSIGHNVCIAAGVQLINTDVPDHTIVTGSYPDYTFRPNPKPITERPPFRYGN